MFTVGNSFDRSRFYRATSFHMKVLAAMTIAFQDAVDQAVTFCICFEENAAGAITDDRPTLILVGEAVAQASRTSMSASASHEALSR